MKLKITEIKLGDRVRVDNGDLTPLRESISKVGLVNPVIVNENYELICGFRRVAACKQLGWETVEANVVNTKDSKLSELELEYQENLGRLGLTDDEIVRYQNKKDELSRPAEYSGLKGVIFKIWKFLVKAWYKLFKRS
jgi:ParB family transcriptional regulator, chromosome partitioning protein